jgi:putative ABC transport system substrate-binding protein
MIESRRVFSAGLASLVALPSSALSQSPGRIPRIGWVTAQHPDSIAAYLVAMREGLVQEGYVEGKTIAIEYRYGFGDFSAVPRLVRELLDSKIDLLIAQGAAAFEVVKTELPVPLIYLISADPVSAGFADSLARPIGNKTGLGLHS